MPKPLVGNVSDTARWVASYRATESAREDALFHDPYAERLAGDQGRAIARKAPAQAGASVVVRTKLLDEMILAEIARGADRVLNLAAGFDARPLRLALPPTLTWIEADLPAILDEKDAMLADAPARCILRRERVDLADPKARDEFLASALEGANRAIVLTEGLLVYLDPADVRGLAASLAARPEVASWLFDLMSPAIVRFTARRMPLDNAPFRFGPPEGVAFFERLGWRMDEVRNVSRECIALRRGPFYLRFFAGMLGSDPRDVERAFWYGVVRASVP
jgi:methyltransferase (TIGR00027 family)